MLKSCKRIVRLLDRNTSLNSSDTPKEVSGLPPPTFAYHSLNQNFISDPQDLSVSDCDYYPQEILHFTIENFRRCIDLNYLLETVVKILKSFVFATVVEKFFF